MAIDLEQFHQVFFEESLEGLEIMESSLMELDPENIDDETVNAIFRCAHSIKGGSATFGFSSISEFTHVLETLLDQIRSGERGINTEEINLYLQSVDCMREMLALIQSGEEGVTEKSESLKADFTNLLDGGSSADNEQTKAQSTNGTVSSEETQFSENDWVIKFSPYPNILLSGNDPLRNLQSLSALGETEISCDVSNMPSLDQLNPECSYLQWEVKLNTSASKEEVLEIFEWIEDDCDLSVQTVAEASAQLEPRSSGKNKWKIEFIPGFDILRTGNEPMRLFRALEEFGQLSSIKVDSSRLPDLHSMDSENCYLSWQIELESEGASKEEIAAVFEWVEDSAEITISSLSEGQNSTELKMAASTAQPASASSSSAGETTTKKIVTPSKTKVAAKKSSAETASIRVGIDKVDNLINMVGELVITQSMLGQLGSDFDVERIPKLMEGLSQLEQNTRELQESVMKIRMLPISFAFSRFPRMIRDLSQSLGKSVELEMRGENTELDKTVMEKIGDPLVHLVRNAVDHGIETPDERSAKGKDPSGKITLNAFHQSGNVVIEIIDDGKGLDRQKIIDKATENGLISEKDASFMSDEQVFDLIFQPGFSTAQVVSDVSGRGVGMDVVKRNIQALSGIVEISSEKDKGSKITIKLPLTLAILDGQLVRVGDNTYIFPLVSIIESLQCQQEFINQVAGGCSVFKLRDDYVPIIELYKSFSITPDSTEIENSLLVVVEAEGEKIGIVVDELLAQQQVVIKSLEQNYRRVNGISGATILGDGTVALILDIPGIVKLSTDQIDVSANNLGNIIHHHEMLTASASAEQRSAAN